jgi:hypothetical protein
MAFDWYGALERVANFEDTIPYVVHECSCYITGGTLRLDRTLRSRCGKSRMGWGWGVATVGRDGIATRSWCYETICLQTEALGQKKNGTLLLGLSMTQQLDSTGTSQEVAAHQLSPSNGRWTRWEICMHLDLETQNKDLKAALCAALLGLRKTRPVWQTHKCTSRNPQNLMLLFKENRYN